MRKSKLNKGTAVYISIAERPSNTGTTVFNAAFEQLGIDAIYKACRVDRHALVDAIAGIRALDIRGCGVSMPFKQEIVKYLDRLDPLAREVGAVNTVVNKKGRLHGYNTDTTAARQMLQGIRGIKNKSILILGAGGVAQAICCALARLNVRHTIVTSRSDTQSRALVKQWQLQGTLPWSQRQRASADILINATPVGMVPEVHEMPITEKALRNFEFIMDVVATPYETRLIATGAKLGKRVLRGSDMALIQALHQFKLYTGEAPPEAVMRRALVKLIKN
ncbi:MAG: shikimate dehydrogenase [Candidatus Andersenbacteria bacterium]